MTLLFQVMKFSLDAQDSWNRLIQGVCNYPLVPQGYIVCHTRDGCSFGAHPEHYSWRIQLDGARGKSSDMLLCKMGSTETACLM